MDLLTHYALEITRQRHRALVAAANRERDAKLARTDIHRRKPLLKWPFRKSGSRSFRDAAGASGKP